MHNETDISVNMTIQW